MGNHQQIGETTEPVGEKLFLRNERRKVIFSAIFAGFLIATIWLIFFFESFFKLDLHFLALKPRSFEGLPGILFEPLLHGGLSHILSNTIPLFLLLTGALYFYRDVGLKITGWIWVLTGILVWCFGRPSLHIGASGMVYGLASFHAFSGFLRNDTRLMSVSMLTIFLYGSLIWGIFPIIPNVSWETHLMGGLSGLFCAILYRKEGPQPKRYFEDESEADEFEEIEIMASDINDPPNQSHSHGSPIRYVYLPSEKDKTEEDNQVKP